MARHKQSNDADRLTADVCVQMTPQQRQELEIAAQESGARLSDYVRDRLFRRSGQPGVVAGVRRNPEAKAIMDDLRRIGNNVNQLAHHANAQGLITEHQALKDVIELMKQAMSRVISL